MKLSIETYIPRDRAGEEAAIRMIADAGFDGIDYSFYFCKPEHQMLGDDYLDRAARTRALLDETGLFCKQAHAPFTFRMGKSEISETDGDYLAIVRAIGYAGILGVRDIVVHPVGSPFHPEFESFNRRFYRSLIPYCEESGVRVAVENLFIIDKKRNANFGTLHTPRLLTDFIKSLESPCFTACVDLGHAAITGTEPESFLAGMSPDLLTSLHVQDGNYLEDSHTLPYLGKFNWDAILQALAEIGYTGDLNFETFKFLSGFPTELLPDALRLAEKTGRAMIERFDTFTAAKA